MKNKFILFSLLFIACIFTNAQTPEWFEPTGYGSSASEYVSDIDFDGDGNYYVTGTFYGSTNFGGYVLDAGAAGASECFLAKFNNNSEIEWIMEIGGDGGDASAHNLYVDEDGNSFIIGYSTNEPFNAGGLTEEGEGDIFVIKVDNLGEVEWITLCGSNATGAYGYGITEDISGNIIITGMVWGDDVEFGGEIFPIEEGWQIFLSQLNSSGSFNWTRIETTGSPISNYSIGYGVVADEDNSIYITGTFENQLFLGEEPDTLHLDGYDGFDIFIAKYNSDGIIQWARKAGSYTVDMFEEAGYNLIIDYENNLVISGVINASGGASVFGPFAVSGISQDDAFVAKYSIDGDVLWVESFTSSGTEDETTLLDMDVDSMGNIYVTGGYEGDLEFNDITFSSPYYYPNTYVAKYKSDGTPDFITATTNDDYLYGVGICVSNEGRIFNAGFYSLDVNIGDYFLEGNNQDIYISEIKCTDFELEVTESGPLTFCEGGLVTLTGSEADNYQWNTGATTAGITVTSSGSYWVIAYSGSCSAKSDTFNVTVNLIPSVPIIDSVGGILLSTPEANYQWYLDGIILVGQTNQFVTPDQNGCYQVKVTNDDGCSEISECFDIIICVAPVADFNSSIPIIFEGETVDFSDITLNDPLTWNWIFEGGYPETSNYQFPPDITYYFEGVYDVTLQTTNECGTSIVDRPNYVEVKSKDTSIIVIEEVESINDISIYPNPNDGNFELTYISNTNSEFSITIYNNIGQVLLIDVETLIDKKFNKTYDLSYLAKGNYLIKIICNNNLIIRKFAIK